jgi:hypothetical protein
MSSMPSKRRIHMISEEQFKALEYEHGCGYWNVCWEHACPCAITTENKGYSEEIYNSLVQEAREVAELFAEEDDDYYPKDTYDNDDYYDDEEEVDCDNVEGGCGCCPYDPPICAKYFEESEEE